MYLGEGGFTYEIKYDEKGNVLINVTLSRVRVIIVAVEKQ